mgnify:CR=1 FL=1
MPTPATAKPTVQFADCELDFQSGEVRRGGEALKLAPQQYQVLALLASRPGELVTRDELRRHLWGDDSYVDFDAGLNFCIAQLRLALGDSAAAPRFIQTAPRRGYRFIAAVVPPAQVTMAVPSRAGWRLLAAGIAGAVTGGLLVAGLTRPIEAGAPAPSAVAAYERARRSLETSDPSELRDRMLLFQRAVAEHPRYADAFAGMAIAHTLAGSIRFAPPDDAYARARAAAQAALAEDADNADAHAALGFEALHGRWAWDESEDHLQRALRRAPTHEFALTTLSRLRSARSRHAEAIALATRALDAAPASTHARLALAWSHLYAGDGRRAAGTCEGAAPSGPQASLQVADCLVYAYEIVGDAAGAAAAARRLEVWDATGANRRGPRSEPMALVLARLHGNDALIAWLRHAVGRHASIAPLLEVHPALATLRADPRFQALVMQIGIREGRR